MKCLRASFFPAFVSLLVAGCTGKQEKIDIIEVKCGTCHTTDRVYETKRSRDEWDRLVSGMKVRGLRLTETEEQAVKDALYNKLGNGK